MNIAVFLYGQPRFYQQGYKYTRKLYQNCNIDYYIHTWGDAETKNALEKFYKPKSIIVEPQKEHFKTFDCEIDISKINKSIFVTLSPLYSMQRLHSFIRCSPEYDFWVVTRTDIGTTGTFSLSELDLHEDWVYSSYVPGKEWLTTHIDLKFVMGNQQSMMEYTNIYNNLDKYLCEEKLPLCHHRLCFRALKHKKNKMEMIGDKNQSFGGWRFIRSNKLSEI
jgi:hypothetical protein